jgi:hypothetical protein
MCYLFRFLNFISKVFTFLALCHVEYTKTIKESTIWTTHKFLSGYLQTQSLKEARLENMNRDLQFKFRYIER